MSGALLFAGLTTVGNGFFVKMIYDTYDALKNTATYEYPYLQRVMRELDLKANLQVIESLLNKVQRKQLAKLEKKNKKRMKKMAMNEKEDVHADAMSDNLKLDEGIKEIKEIKEISQGISESDEMMVKDYINKDAGIGSEANETYKDLNNQIEELSEFQRLDESNSDPLLICFQNVSEMVKQIKEELEKIQIVIKKHEEKYFYTWRTPDYDKNLKRIIEYKKSLDQRVEILIKLLSLN